MAMNEAVIRDNLGRRLDLFEPGLELLDIEKYIPNRRGTRGFIDILARDVRGRFVLIELKRSDASSRDATHEVLKYVEGIKQLMAVRDDELRAFIVSTEWKELLIPFSSLCLVVTFPLEGYALAVTDAGIPTLASRVTPLPMTGDRLFAPWHEVNLYENSESLAKGGTSYGVGCAQKGIEDYVLLQLRPNTFYREREIEATYAQMHQMAQKIGFESKSREEVAQSLPVYTSMLYFAMLQLDSAFCIERIRNLAEDEDFDEFLGCIEGENNEAVLCIAHEKLMDVGDGIFRDHFEIGYPAKFKKILDEEGWIIECIHRFGALAKNTVLSDDVIIEELRGHSGVTGQSYKKKLTDTELQLWPAVRKDVATCLRDNPQWESQIRSVFDDIERLGHVDEIDISIFNPSNILLSLFLLGVRDGLNELPSYSVMVTRGSEIFGYFGILRMTQTEPSLRNIVDTHYGSSCGKALFSLQWGGYEQENFRVVRDAGLTYATLKVRQAGQNHDYWCLTDLGFEPRAPTQPFAEIEKYLSERSAFIADIQQLFGCHWDGVMVDYSEAEQYEPNT